MCSMPQPWSRKFLHCLFVFRNKASLPVRMLSEIINLLYNTFNSQLGACVGVHKCVWLKRYCFGVKCVSSLCLGEQKNIFALDLCVDGIKRRTRSVFVLLLFYKKDILSAPRTCIHIVSKENGLQKGSHTRARHILLTQFQLERVLFVRQSVRRKFEHMKMVQLLIYYTK